MEEEEREFYPEILIDPIENKIKFMCLNLRGNFEWEEPYMVKKPEYDKWEFWVDSINKNAPEGMNNMI